MGNKQVRLINSEKLRRDFPVDRIYLIGVSGGRDSVVLLHHLNRLGYQHLVVCHLNHRLRGRASSGDANFVNALAAKYGCDLAIGSVDVRGLAAKSKMSIETAGRAARYQFFASVAKRRRCHTLFLAHHADDLVETFLLNLFRGAGLAGLRGMREATARRVNGVHLEIVRPMLSAWRVDIDQYVGKHRVKFREDASNKNLDPMRNRLRHRVIPYLEKVFGRNLRPSIWRTAAIVAEEEAFWETLLPHTGRTLSIKVLRSLSVALQRRTLRQWLKEVRVPDIGFDLIERVRSLIDSAAGVARTNVPQDRHIRRRAGKLFLE